MRRGNMHSQNTIDRVQYERTNIAVMIGLQYNVSLERRALDNERGIVGQRHVTVGVVALTDMSGAAVVEILERAGRKHEYDVFS